MRAWIFVVLCLASCGPDAPCEKGTLSIDVKIDGAVTGTTLEIDVAVDGMAGKVSRIERPSSVRSGEVVVTFPRGYPAGARVAVAMRVFDGTTMTGAGAADKSVAAGCDQLSLAVAPAAPDQDLSGADFVAAPDDLFDAAVDADGFMPDLAPEPDLAKLPLIVVSTNHDYLSLAEGTTSAAVDFTVQNPDSTPTAMLTVSIAGTDAAQFHVDSENCSPFQLAPAAMCHVMVSFRPSGASPRSAILTIEDARHRGQATLTGVALGANGTSCTMDQHCQNGHCVDGVCCDMAQAACNGCKACNLAGNEGTCSDVPAGLDPHDFCTEKCADKCDGAAACRKKALGALCQTDLSCSNANMVGQQWTTAYTGAHVCDGAALTCPTALTGTCANALACDTGSGSCRTMCSGNEHCIVGKVCVSGQCQPCGALTQPCCDGATCASKTALCSSGTCVACGGLNQPCCANQACGALTSCQSGTCQPCGRVDQLCCPGSTCDVTSSLPERPLVACYNSFCRLCGGDGQPCCPLSGTCSTSGACCDSDRTCIPPGSTCPNSGGICSNGSCGGGGCGGYPQSCCNGWCTAHGLACYPNNTCNSCGLEGTPCCKGTACWNQAGLSCLAGTCTAACGGSGKGCCRDGFYGVNSNCADGSPCPLNNVCP